MCKTQQCEYLALETKETFRPKYIRLAYFERKRNWVFCFDTIMIYNDLRQIVVINNSIYVYRYCTNIIFDPLNSKYFKGSILFNEEPLNGLSVSADWKTFVSMGILTTSSLAYIGYLILARCTIIPLPVFLPNMPTAVSKYVNTVK